MEKILVTGGLGFIGSHIAEHFYNSGFGVSILDNSKDRSNLSEFGNAIEVRSSSISDYASVLRASRDVRIIFHQAALVSVPQSIENPELTRKINVEGTRNVLKAAVESGVSRVVLASSSAVYGKNKPPLRETMDLDPLSPYAESKIQNEKDAFMYYEKHNLETVSLRYFNVYGPRQNPNSQYAAVIPRFISLLKSGKSPVIYGDGTQTRDFVYVKDVVEANSLASKSGKTALGKAFNIGSGNPTSLLSLLSVLGKISKTKTQPIFEPERKGDIKHSHAEVSLAQKELKFRAKWALESGLREAYASF